MSGQVLPPITASVARLKVQSFKPVPTTAPRGVSESTPPAPRRTTLAELVAGKSPTNNMGEWDVHEEAKRRQQARPAPAPHAAPVVESAEDATAQVRQSVRMASQALKVMLRRV